MRRKGWQFRRIFCTGIRRRSRFYPAVVREKLMKIMPTRRLCFGRMVCCIISIVQPDRIEKGTVRACTENGERSRSLHPGHGKGCSRREQVWNDLMMYWRTGAAVIFFLFSGFTGRHTRYFERRLIGSRHAVYGNSVLNRVHILISWVSSGGAIWI